MTTTTPPADTGRPLTVPHAVVRATCRLASSSTQPAVACSVASS